MANGQVVTRVFIICVGFSVLCLLQFDLNFHSTFRNPGFSSKGRITRLVSK